jgi:hypothetical protein
MHSQRSFEWIPLDTVFALKEIVKVKVTLEQAVKAQRGSRGIALLFL